MNFGQMPRSAAPQYGTVNTETRIKICGFTAVEDVRAAVELGVDALGFNFAKGPRKISPQHGASLVRALSPFTTSVALFVDADEATILEAMRVSRCQVVQLHGQESPELAESLRKRFPVIKAFRVRDSHVLQEAAAYPADALLLDAWVDGAEGGTGHSWDYSMVREYTFQSPIILAGGLHAHNVATAIAALQPWAVDVASGVESGPGRKEKEQMAAFVRAVKGAI